MNKKQQNLFYDNLTLLTNISKLAGRPCSDSWAEARACE